MRLWAGGWRQHGGEGSCERPCLCPTRQPGHEGLRPGEGWRGLAGSWWGKEGPAQMTAGDRMTWSPSCCRCNKGGERGGRRGLATALPAALGLKLSHFAGSSTARTGGSKIGTARKIHLAEASVQQSGRGAARRRGRMERGRGCGEETLHSLLRPSHPWGQILSTPPPAVYITPTQPPLHTQAKALKSPQGHSGLMG